MALSAQLKGCDALVYRAFHAAGLEVTFHYVCIVAPGYYDKKRKKACILPSGAQESGEGYCEDGFGQMVSGHEGRTAEELGVLEIRTPKDLDRAFNTYGDSKTDPDDIIGAPFRYIAYGNDPSVAVEYASICIIGSQPGQDINDHWPAGQKTNRW